MTHIQRSALLPYTAEQMFELVNRVDRYPEFLPWCSETAILEESDVSMRARLTVSKAGLRQSFTTRNALVSGRQIDMRLEDGPFSDLHGTWDFKPLSEQACKISLDLRFEYSGPIIRATLGPLFNHAANTLVDAFSQRAKELYGG